MSTASAGVRQAWHRAWSARTFALLGAATLLAAAMSVLYGIVNVSGDPRVLLALAVGAVVGATLLARTVRVVTAVTVASLLLAGGMVLYVSSLPYTPALENLLESNVALLSGRSLLQIRRAAVWALAVAPAPVFVTWYLALRRWYVGAALVGGALLGYFVLTTDAGATVTLLGVVSAAGTVAFGDLDRRDGSTGAAEAVAVLLAVMVLVPSVLTVVPGNVGSPLLGDDGGAETVEQAILSDDANLDIVGDISLSPKVRFRVTSPRPDYWRVNSYDRYTGDGWIRTGETEPYDGSLSAPPGPSVQLEQEYRFESRLSVMPAAWRPVAVGGGVSGQTRVTAGGGLRSTEAFDDGDSYTVTSETVRKSPRALARAGTDYPERIRERYLQLPADMPDRVARRTERLTQNADNPYETALVVEQWLETNREYSLDVEKPDGNVADAFLFEMERGYCTYYATTMVVMLRTEGIPARLTTGYTTGQPVDADTYVVRGYNAHTWVEVYFPGTGWVRFDPTPAGPRREAEQSRLQEARESGASDVDVPGSRETPTPTPAEETPTASTPTTVTTPDDPFGPGPNATPTAAPPGGDTTPDREEGPAGGGFEPPDLPSRERLALWLVVLGGAVAGVRRSGLNRRLSWWVQARLGGPDDPDAVIERTFQRLEYHLERRHRPREEGETVRSYLAAVDANEHARRVAALRERARYGGEATQSMADDAREAFRRFRRERAETAVS